MKKILYLFTGGRRLRLNQMLAGEESPQEFLFGAPYLMNRGYEVDILELSELANERAGVLRKFEEKKNNITTRMTQLTSCSHLLNTQTVSQFNRYDVVVASNEYLALGLLPYKTKGILRSPLVFFVMGMLARLYDVKSKRLRYFAGRSIYRRLVESSRKCIFLGAGEYGFARELFGGFEDRLTLLPYPVDTTFWRPGRTDGAGEYILFMGNDQHRDFELALNIAREMRQCKFKFVTKQIDSDKIPQNVELLVGDWRESLLSDVEVREIIGNSSVIILPLKETLQPSGQSVGQQAMACGKTVILTRTRGFWCPEDFIDGEHLVFVENNSLTEWCNVINHLMSEKAKLADIGVRARRLMEEKFTIKAFGAVLEGLIFPC